MINKDEYLCLKLLTTIFFWLKKNWRRHKS